MAETIVAPKVDVAPDSIQKLTDEQKAIAKQIHDEAVSAGIDPEFALATAWQENRFRPSGKSSAGAIGTMQIMPATARSYGVTLRELKDPATNIKLGIQILKDNLDRRDGDKRLALIDYNAGPKVTDSFLKANENIEKLPKETQNYLQSIGQYHAIETHHGNEPSPFDNLGVEEDLGESPFGEAGELPPHLQAGAEQQPEESSLLEDVGRYAFQNPEVPTIGIGTGVAQSRINDAMQRKAFEEGLRRAQMPQAPQAPVGGQHPMQPPAQPMAGQPMTSGDKWSAKTVGSMGPGGESTTEAARNYRIQQRLNVGEDVQNPRWQASREGIILPRGEQESVDLQRARQIIEEVERNKSPLQRAKEAINVQTQRPTPAALGKLGAIGKVPFLGPLSTGTMGAYSAHKFNEAERLDQSGDALGAALARLNGFASGIGAIPATPYVPLNVVKGTGMAASAGISGIEALKNLMFPYKSVVEEKRPMPPQIKKADGGYIPLSLRDVYFHRKARG